MVLATTSCNLKIMVYLFGPYFFRKKMATQALAENEPMSQPETDSDSESDNEDFSDAPDMQDLITASAELKELNETAKALKETIKRKRDEIEQYMIEKDAKYMRLDGMTVLMKKSKKLSWAEKALREHVDEDGKLDIDVYKSSQTQVVEKMTVKFN